MDDLTTLARYTSEHCLTVATPEEGTIDVHFFHVLPTKTFDAAEFRRLFDAWLANGPGAFDEAPTLDEIKGGPSYIRWGYLLGDQSLALMLMGLGAAAGMWSVVTPKTLDPDMPTEKADEMAGLGFVMSTGLKAAA